MSRPRNIHPSGLSWREREIQREKDRVADEALKKEEERLRHIKITDDNFPSLSGEKAFQKPKTIASSGTFAKLASEWREQDEIEKNRKQREEEENQRWRHEWIHRPRIVPTRFEANRVYDEQDDEESHTPKYGYEDEREWTTVDTKRYVPNVKRQIEYNDEDDSETEDFEQNADIIDNPHRDY